MDLKRYDEALRYFNIGLKAFESISMSAGIGASYVNITEILRNQKKYREALETARKAEKVLLQSGNKLHLAYTYDIMGKLYGLLNDRAQQLEYLRKSLALSRENKDDFMIAQTQGDLGRAFMEMGDMPQAKQYMDTSLALAEKMQQKSVIIEGYARLRDWYLLQRNFELAQLMDEQYNMGMDSVFNAKMAEKIADSETKYETEKKESAIRDLENQNRIKRFQTYGALAGILALLVLLYLMRRAYRQRQRLAAQQEQLQRSTIERLETERKVVALNARLEGQQLERLRIAEDLHDDFGSGLSKISLLSEVAKRKASVSGELDKISAAAKELLLKMSEIVWALNHHNDTLPSLASYIRRYAVGFFEDSDIVCHFDIPELPVAPLSSESRRNIFLVVKETLHNTLKHAHASQVDIQFSLQHEMLEIHIHDNGRGFDATLKNAGNGLHNMEKRMQQSGGTFEVSGTPEKGTMTRICLPMQKQATAM
jgi:signal transduction histidine kinase